MSYREQHILAAGQKRKRGVPDDALERLAWTEARCSRLLRTITSRIELLRALLRPDSKSAKPAGRLRKHEHWSTTDPVWLPDGVKKARSHTYAGKAKGSRAPAKSAVRESRAHRPLALPSPFIRRLQDPNATTHETPARPRAAPVAKRRSRQLPVMPGSPKAEAELGLKNAMTAFLSSTADSSTPPPHTGARSLVSTCLRQVPAYIHLDEEGRTDTGSHVQTSTSEILGFLEGLGTMQGAGWNGLREVVRSQGIRYIVVAVSDNTLSEALVAGLVDICTSSNARFEAEEILQAWICRRSRLDSIIIGTLKGLCSRPNMRNVGFSVMQAISDRYDYSIMDVLRETDTWNDLLAAITRSPDNGASAVLQRCVHLHQQHRSGPKAKHSDPQANVLSTGLRELASKVFTMAVAGLLLEQVAADSATPYVTLQRLAVERFLESNLNGKLDLSDPWTVASMLLTALARQCTFNEALVDVDWCRAEFGVEQSGFRKDTAVVIGTLAQDIVALDNYAELGLVDRLFRRFIEVRNAKRLSTAANQLLRDFTLEVSAIYRQADGADNEVNSDVLDAVTAHTLSSPPPYTPRRAQVPSRLRWEDGICEWVLKTPFTVAVDSSGGNCPSEDTQDDNEDTCSLSSREDKENAIPSPDLKRPSSIGRSPDVLVLSSPPAKRIKRSASGHIKQTTRRALVEIRGSTQGIITGKVVKRGSSRRVDLKEDDSGDELAF